MQLGNILNIPCDDLEMNTWYVPREMVKYCQHLPKLCDVHFKFWHLVLGNMPQVSLPWKQVKAHGANLSLHILFCCALMKEFRLPLTYYLYGVGGKVVWSEGSLPDWGHLWN